MIAGCIAHGAVRQSRIGRWHEAVAPAGPFYTSLQAPQARRSGSAVRGANALEAAPGAALAREGEGAGWGRRVSVGKGGGGATHNQVHGAHVHGVVDDQELNVAGKLLQIAPLGEAGEAWGRAMRHLAAAHLFWFHQIGHRVRQGQLGVLGALDCLPQGPDREQPAERAGEGATYAIPRRPSHGAVLLARAIAARDGLISRCSFLTSRKRVTGRAWAARETRPLRTRYPQCSLSPRWTRC